MEIMRIYLICTAMATGLGAILVGAANITASASAELIQLGHYGGALMMVGLVAFVLGCIVYILD